MNQTIDYFKEISKIPRCSGEEKALSDYLKQWAEERNFEVYQDELSNLIITRKASPLYKNSPKVILQGHLDMVCEKRETSDHDFTKDPIGIIQEGSFIKAKDTTLGADNGIGIAMILSVLEEDKELPEIEALFTTCEETGLEGATGLSETVLKGEYLINIDSDEEGILTVGCSGGETIEGMIKFPFEKGKKKGYRLSIMNLPGGHSGADIHLNISNAIVMMGEILKEWNDGSMRISQITGGSKHNTIPSYGMVQFALEDLPLKDVQETIEKAIKTNPEVKINVEEIEIIESINEKNTMELLELITHLPNGVRSFMTGEFSHIVKTSSNLAIIKTENKNIEITLSIRSSHKSELIELKNIIKELFEEYGEVKFSGAYSPWEFVKESKLRDLAIKTYEDIYGEPMKVEVIHAGLECAVFQQKYRQLDMISVGPNMWGIHTPEERLDIESTDRVYNYILELLMRIK